MNKQMREHLKQLFVESMNKRKETCDNTLSKTNSEYLDLILNGINSDEDLADILKGEKPPRIDRDKRSDIHATELEKEYQNLFKQKYEIAIKESIDVEKQKEEDFKNMIEDKVESVTEDSEMDKQHKIDQFRKTVEQTIQDNENKCKKALLLLDDLYMSSILNSPEISKIYKGEEAPEIDRFLQEYPVVTELEREYQDKFRAKYNKILAKGEKNMNAKIWAKLRLYKNTDGSAHFINLENSDISDLRIFEIYEVSDRFTLYPGDKIYLFNTPYTIEYVGLTNNSMLFKYDWIHSKGYATIPFGVNDVRVCVSVDDKIKTTCPIITEEEYGTDLDYSLGIFKLLLDNDYKNLPKIVEPSPQPKYLYLDGKYTMFLNDDVEKEQVEGTFYKFTNLRYGVFVKIIDNIPQVTEIYCEKGYEDMLANRIMKMINGEFNSKVEIASL